MNKYKVLNKLKNKNYDIEQVYSKLYPASKRRKSRYIKMKMVIPDSKGVTTLLKVIFAFPIPVWLLKKMMRNNNQLISDEFPIKINDLLSTGLAKGMFIKVNSVDGAKITIKAI